MDYTLEKCEGCVCTWIEVQRCRFLLIEQTPLFPTSSQYLLHSDHTIRDKPYHTHCRSHNQQGFSKTPPFNDQCTSLEKHSYCMSRVFVKHCLWPKNNVKGFLWMKAENRNSALWQSCWRRGVSRMSKSSFSYFSVFGLVCCFVGYCGMVLVSCFQWWSMILLAQGIVLYEQCEA